MKAQHLLLVIPVVIEAFTSTGPAFTRHAAPQQRPSTHLMDTEAGVMDLVSRRKIDALLRPKQQVSEAPRPSVEEAEASQGMPWTSSIDASANDDDALLYMPFWEWQMSYMKEHLTDLKVEPITIQNGHDFGYNENTGKKARIVSLEFSSKEYRKIRMTYYDAGTNTQVFNSVWYPSPEYDLPILGVDLLAFNRKKYLAIVDFQPLHENIQDHAVDFEGLLEPIKDSYDSLNGRMSSKFYDETQFFSQQMLFARFEDEQVVSKDLLPAFQQYVATHHQMLKSTTPEPSRKVQVLERQQAYDTYSAERDPATGLFTAMFGQEWANGFVHDFLFSLSEKKEGGVAAFMPPMMGGGGPPPQAVRQQQRAPQPQPQLAA